ncbi:hypothetical protein FACS189427_13790 [Planctomycetales bacterium]|nr:hypothetical protein FACS189427_13790 [Planctomycetales bacterium]
MAQLPNYVASAQPVPYNNRIGWLSATAATYAGVMLWFVFWQDVPTGGQSAAGGTLSVGLIPAIIALTIAAVICHVLYFMVPGLLGMKTGLPLSTVGTSTYGVTGGFLMPGLLMGILQFGWLSVNAFFSGLLLAVPFTPAEQDPMMSPLHLGIAVVWALIAMFMGLKGIKYVGAVASFMPIIPIVILAMLLVKTLPTYSDFSVDKMMAAENNKIEKANAQLPAVKSQERFMQRTTPETAGRAVNRLPTPAFCQLVFQLQHQQSILRFLQENSSQDGAAVPVLLTVEYLRN